MKDSTSILQRGARQLAWRAIARPKNELRRLWLIRRIKWQAFLHRSTVDVDIAPGVQVEGKIQVESGARTHTKLYIGPKSRLRFGVRLRLFGGTMYLGERTDVRDGATLTVSGGTLTLDGYSNIGNTVGIHCGEWIHVKKHAQISEHSTVSDNSHFHSDPDVWSYKNTRTAPINIGVDVWVCPKCTVTSGVTIGDYVIIGANSVVTKDVPSGVLASGVPAKVIRELGLEWVKE